ncbi:hypothetical protein T492DRAFT_935351 [Pavlovales sp. CCMP2436]|nr:hypothetical protein T492DRAFT_935351 [Pavlovales sp. CCMP2436]
MLRTVCLLGLAALQGTGRVRSPARGSRVAASASASATRFTNLLPLTTAAPELTAVQRARTIGASAESGVLSTLHEQASFPFSAAVNFVLNERGEPVFMLKAGSVTQANAAIAPSASLLVVDTSVGKMLTLQGAVVTLPEHEFAESHVNFLNVHPVARECMATGGLAFYKMTVQKCYMQSVETTAADGAWLPVDAYSAATIDALAPFSKAIVESVNGPKRADLRKFCETYFGSPLSHAELVGLDELGFDVEVAAALPASANKRSGRDVEGGQAKARRERRRVGFDGPRRTEQEARSLFVKAFFQAWDPPSAESPPAAN